MPTKLPQKKPDKVAFKNKWSKAPSQSSGSHRDYDKLKPYVNQGIIYTATIGGEVVARQRETGDILWQKKLASGVASGPVVKNGYVALGTVDAKVTVLSAADGETLWTARVSNQLLAPPALSGQKLFAKTVDGNLYAYQVNGGHLVWRYHHGAPKLILRASSAPKVYGKTVIAGFGDGKLEGINVDTGQVMWKRRVGFSQGSSDVERMIDIGATPVIRDGVLYAVSYQGHVSAISLSSGQVIWQHKLSAYKDMALGKKQLFVTDSESTIWAFNLSNGSVVWRQQALKNRGLSAPVVSRYGLLVTDKLGFIHALSQQSGELLGRLHIAKQEIDASPVVVGDHVYVLTDNGTLNDLKVSRS